GVERTAHTQVAVAHGEKGLHLVLARRIEAFLLDAPRLFRRRRPDRARPRLLAKARIERRHAELAEIRHHHVGPAAHERFAVAAAIDADHETESAAVAGEHARG